MSEAARLDPVPVGGNPRAASPARSVPKHIGSATNRAAAQCFFPAMALFPAFLIPRGMLARLSQNAPPPVLDPVINRALKRNSGCVSSSALNIVRSHDLYLHIDPRWRQARCPPERQASQRGRAFIGGNRRFGTRDLRRDSHHTRRSDRNQSGVHCPCDRRHRGFRCRNQTVRQHLPDRWLAARCLTRITQIAGSPVFSHRQLRPCHRYGATVHATD